MAEVCDIKDQKYFRESYITPALEDGVIELLYPDQPKHLQAAISVAEAAKKWLKNNSVLSKS